MKKIDLQIRTCKGICKKFQVKKPTKQGRYGLGQAHCQVCDTWIDHNGSHMKNGTPAVEYSLGWFCNCCNYRVRQKPRNKVYKEKLRSNTKKPILSYEEVKHLKKTLQNKSTEKTKNKKTETIDKASLSGGKFLYGNKTNQVKKSIQQLKKENMLDVEFKKQFKNENKNEIFRENEGNKEFFEGIKDNKNKINQDEIYSECELLIKNYKKRRGLDDTVFDDFIDVFIYCKTEYPNPINALKTLIDKTDFEIRESFRNLLRVPDKLREYVNDGKLSFDPILSKEIAIHATDLFQWDGQKEIEDKVFQLAVSMSKCFSDPDNLDMKKEFFTNPVDETTPISGPSRTAQINVLKEKYPVIPSPFDRYRDRSKFDYWKLVSIKNLKIAEFVLKWEHEHRQRISKKWANELLQDPEQFFSKQSF